MGCVGPSCLFLLLFISFFWKTGGFMKYLPSLGR